MNIVSPISYLKLVFQQFDFKRCGLTFVKALLITYFICSSILFSYAIYDGGFDKFIQDMNLFFLLNPLLTTISIYMAFFSAIISGIKKGEGSDFFFLQPFSHQKSKYVVYSLGTLFLISMICLALVKITPIPYTEEFKQLIIEQRELKQIQLNG